MHCETADNGKKRKVPLIKYCDVSIIKQTVAEVQRSIISIFFFNTRNFSNDLIAFISYILQQFGGICQWSTKDFVMAPTAKRLMRARFTSIGKKIPVNFVQLTKYGRFSCLI